jgi:hypothetical protein
MEAVTKPIVNSGEGASHLSTSLAVTGEITVVLLSSAY